MSHLRYLKYVLRHKWFVFVAGRVLGAPLWRLIIHDWTKFTPAEWGPYVRQFFSPGPKGGIVVGFNFNEFPIAWNHHWHNNPHHWEYWLKPNVDRTPIKMPEKFVREMVADWCGAGRAITGKWDIMDWFTDNQDRIVLHHETWQLVDSLVAIAQHAFSTEKKSIS